MEVIEGTAGTGRAVHFKIPLLRFALIDLPAQLLLRPACDSRGAAARRSEER
jgi:hypothetical protein